MHDLCTFDYAIIRFVPRVEREEFINVGIILSCPAQKVLEARIEPNWDRLQVFAPELSRETIDHYLSVISSVCAGGESAGVLGTLKERERFYWLTAPRSTIIQTSPVHTGFTTDVERTIERLLDGMVRQ